MASTAAGKVDAIAGSALSVEGEADERRRVGSSSPPQQARGLPSRTADQARRNRTTPPRLHLGGRAVRRVTNQGARGAMGSIYKRGGTYYADFVDRQRRRVQRSL